MPTHELPTAPSPHLVDRVVFVDARRIHAFLLVTRNDALLRGYPYMPASHLLAVLVEAGAQLVRHVIGPGCTPALDEIPEVEFLGTVRVGERLDLEAWIDETREATHRIGVCARVGDELRARGTVTIAA